MIFLPGITCWLYGTINSLKKDLKGEKSMCNENTNTKNNVIENTKFNTSFLEIMESINWPV